MAGTLTKDQILDGIAELTVIELSELLKDFEERFGVTAAAPAAVAAAPAAGGGEAAGAADEQTAFDVILTAAGDKKIQVIKEVRGLTSLGSRKPRTSWTLHRSRFSRRLRRKTPRRPRLPSRAPAPPSSSSSPSPSVRDPRLPGPKSGFWPGSLTSAGSVSRVKHSTGSIPRRLRGHSQVCVVLSLDRHYDRLLSCFPCLLIAQDLHRFAPLHPRMS